jgi:hypothetical protein
MTILNLKLELKSEIADKLTRFDTNWNRLQHYCSTAQESDEFILPNAFKSFSESLEAKAALLSYILPSSMESIVNL